MNRGRGQDLERQIQESDKRNAERVARLEGALGEQRRQLRDLAGLVSDLLKQRNGKPPATATKGT